MSTIENNDAWDVITSYFNDKGLIHHQLETYNDFIFNKIQKIVDASLPLNFHIEEKNKETDTNIRKLYNIKFGQVFFNKPECTDSDGSTIKLYPQMARLRKLNYCSSMFVEVIKTEYLIEEKDNITKTTVLNEPEVEKIFLGKIPIMLNSDLCNLKGLNKMELASLNEDLNELGGYFIMKGSEKVIIGQERINLNQAFIFQEKDNLISAQIRSLPTDETRNINRINIDYTQLKSSKLIEKKVFRVVLQYINSPIPLFLIFKGLGIENDNEIYDYILPEDKRFNNDYLDIIETSREESFKIKTRDDALNEIGKFASYNYVQTLTDKEKRVDFVRHILTKDFLPHLGVTENDMNKKAIYLGHVVFKMIKVILGERDFDDRDHFGNKRVDSTGALIEMIFKQSFDRFVKEVKKECNKIINENRPLTSVNVINSINNNNEIITKDMKNCLGTGNWTVNKKSNVIRTGVSQVLIRLSYIGTLSYLRKITSPVAKEGGKNIKPRLLHNTQWGILCPVGSPDGKNCGYIKQLSMLATISIDTDTSFLYEYILNKNNNFVEDIYDVKSIGNKTKIFINGDLIGLSKDDLKLYKSLKKLKLSSVIPPETAIIYNNIEKEININTDSGRLYRPLLVVEEGKLKLTDKHIEQLKNNVIDWKYLVTNGIVEYVDPNEEEQLLICMYPNELNNTLNNYTHSEIHPSMILCESACMIPFANHNMTTRNIFQTAQARQAVGIYSLNHHQRMDTMGHMLWYPQRPIARTKGMDYLGIDDIPAGVNAIVAIACFTGYNQEDSILINKSAVERGFFISSYFSLYESEIGSYQSKHNYTEKFEKPTKDNVEGIKRDISYDHLDDNGLPRLGYKLQPRQPIIGKTQLTKTTENGEKKEIRKDASLYLKQDESGIVDKVFIGNNEDGQKIAKVKLREMRIPEIGDKASSRHGQKGIIGMMFNQEDLPCSESGIVPDLIINPNSQTSRMTVAHLIECLYSKEGALNATIKDCTPFEEFKPENIYEELKKYGFEEYGNEKMYNGMNGEVMDAKIFIGPTYYQRFKHMVRDKYHVRSRGPMQPLVRQPSEGRSRSGGLRVGKMIAQAIIKVIASKHTACKILKLRGTPTY